MGRRSTALLATRLAAPMNRRSGGTVRAILARDRRCWLCGWTVPELEASRDHAIPKSHGGYDKASNYRLAHRLCNSARGNLPIAVVVRVLHTLEPGTKPHTVRETLNAALIEWRSGSKEGSVNWRDESGPSGSAELEALERARARRERWERRNRTPNQRRLDQLLDGFARRKRRRR